MDQPRIIRASQVRPREIEWLWYPFIPYGKVTILQGDAGDGKSTFILKLAAMLSRGDPMPVSEIERRTKAAGISMSTVKKAKPVLGIQSVKQGASWLWVLPPDKPPSLS